MATTLASLLSQLNDEIRMDRNNKIWGQALKEQYINQAYFQIQKDMGLRFRKAQGTDSFSTVAGTREYNLPSDFLMARLVTYNGEPLDSVEYEDLKWQNLGDVQGVPYEYYINGDVIGLHALPNGVGTVILYYRKKLPVLTDLVSTTLSVDFDLPIVKYAAYLLWSGPRGNFDTAKAKLGDYQQAKTSLWSTYILQDQGALTFKNSRYRKNFGSTPRNLTY